MKVFYSEICLKHTPKYEITYGHSIVHPDTWKATYESAQVCISGAIELKKLAYESDQSSIGIFCLCRPPGHHANQNLCGGYCFLNNVAIVTNILIDKEKNLKKVVILDIDYHHGNGTQDIFYSDSNPLYVSFHAENDYPWYTGDESEIGIGEGESYNINVPLSKNTDDQQYLEQLKNIINNKIIPYNANYLAVSLGVDTYKDDPIGGLNLTSECYLEIGKLIKSINLPTLFVLEGGYHLETIGINHTPKYEITYGHSIVHPESPSRLTIIKSHLIKLKEQNNNNSHDFEILSPQDYGLDPILSVHDKDYVDFLQNSYYEWCEEGGNKDGVVPDTFAHFGMKTSFNKKKITSTLAKAGLYCFDTTYTWKATYESAQVCISGAIELKKLAYESDQSSIGIFCLCRPPGHHANQNLCGGYCFLNNVAIVTNILIDKEKNLKKVVILDIDYHHGNGTQDIFYSDSNPLYVSFHAENDYPWYTGDESEIGIGEGESYNINVPLSKNTDDQQYLEQLKNIINNKIIPYNANYLAVSLGVDTYKDDPIGGLNLTSECYLEIGKLIKSINLPTLFVLEATKLLNPSYKNNSFPWRFGENEGLDLMDMTRKGTVYNRDLNSLIFNHWMMRFMTDFTFIMITNHNVYALTNYYATFQNIKDGLPDKKILKESEKLVESIRAHFMASAYFKDTSKYSRYLLPGNRLKSKRLLDQVNWLNTKVIEMINQRKQLIKESNNELLSSDMLTMLLTLKGDSEKVRANIYEILGGAIDTEYQHQVLGFVICLNPVLA
ncbi:20592_t:CDS:10 [Entrophospora sp. SA101]|nr:20592_t:CDS:10 [Entrophospora sp. SA101]